MEKKWNLKTKKNGKKNGVLVIFKSIQNLTKEDDMHTSKKYQKKAQALEGQGDFVLCDAPKLTKHAKRRCDERNIKHIHVLGERVHAIVKNGAVVTVWQKPRKNYGVRSSKGIEHMRKTHKAVKIPKEVLKHFPQYSVKYRGKLGQLSRKKSKIVKKSHMTISQRKKLKENSKDTATKVRKKTQQKRKDAAKAFEGLVCSMCKEEKYKKNFSERQFKLVNPKCIECVLQYQKNELSNSQAFLEKKSKIVQKNKKIDKNSKKIAKKSKKRPKIAKKMGKSLKNLKKK